MGIVPSLTELLLDIAAGEASPLDRKAKALLGQYHAIRLAIDLFERNWRLSGAVERARAQVDSLVHRYNGALVRYEEPGTTAADADIRGARQPRPQQERRAIVDDPEALLKRRVNEPRAAIDGTTEEDDQNARGA